MIIQHFTMDLRCSNHLGCNARALFNAESKDACIDKAKRAGWWFFIRRTTNGNVLDDCKCKDCRQNGR